MIHCNCAADALRSARMLGIATLTIVASIDTINRLRQQDIKMMALRRAVTMSSSRRVNPLKRPEKGG
ncbi:hypothetical protein MPUL_31080 [Mycolicibacterium pulveris]|uniref:Uncharacterized protein n=1 Tax=Mycolicibacterium pulveris TaxID=36813 RepID=A0A7I7ULT8_MYCPV|nr:hypothetical protein MPUL_31080 [Mycolicibacterium pulveris]